MLRIALEGSSSKAKTPHALSEIAAAVNGRHYRGSEEDILRLENVIPGLGGVFVDANHDLVVYAPKGIAVSMVKAALSEAGVQAGLPRELQSQLNNAAHVRVIAGESPFSQLVAWQGQITSRLAGVPHVAGIDADETKNRVRVVISKESSRNAVEKIAASLGIPKNALLVVVGPQMTAASGLRGTWRPTGAGIQLQVADGRTCTMGFNVTTPLGVTGFLTAGHCALGQPGVGRTGDVFYQPMIGPTYALGQVTNNPAWNLTVAECFGMARCTDSDVLFVTYDNPANADKRMAFTAQPGEHGAGGSITVTGWWTQMFLRDNLLPNGSSIDKIGPVTGWTIGIKSSTCEHTPMTDAYGSYMLVCTNHMSDSQIGQGDSGAPVIIHGTSTLKAVEGIIVGGGPMTLNDGAGQKFCQSLCSIVYIPWAHIETRLGTPLYPNR